MDRRKYRTHKLLAHAHRLGSKHTRCHYVVVTSGLYYRHVVLLLEGPYLARHIHTLAEHFKQLVVELVDLTAQVHKILGGDRRVAKYQIVENHAKHLGRYLLVAVTPCAIRVTVAFDYQAIETHVESLLRERSYQLTFATDVARIAYDRECREPATQFQRYAPLRMIAVDLRAISGKATVYHTETANTGIIKTLKRAYP